MHQGDSWKSAVRRHFGNRVRELRGEQGITQEALALRCGIDRSYLGQVERGERNITLENIHRLAGGLDVSVDALFVSADEIVRGAGQ